METVTTLAAFLLRFKKLSRILKLPSEGRFGTIFEVPGCSTRLH